MNYLFTIFDNKIETDYISNVIMISKSIVFRLSMFLNSINSINTHLKYYSYYLLAKENI